MSWGCCGFATRRSPRAERASSISRPTAVATGTCSTRARAGRPRALRSTSVLTPDAAVADALSTAFLVAGPELARSVCAARPGTIALLVLDAQPHEILAVGKRDRVTVDPAAGVHVVEATP